MANFGNFNAISTRESGIRIDLPTNHISSVFVRIPWALLRIVPNWCIRLSMLCEIMWASVFRQSRCQKTSYGLQHMGKMEEVPLWFNQQRVCMTKFIWERAIILNLTDVPCNWWLWSHGMSWLGFSRVRVNTLIFRERTELQGHQVVCCGWIGWALYPQFDAFIMICLMCLMFFPSWICHLGVKQISEMPTFWVNYHHKSFTNLKCWAILGMLPRILTMFIVRENSEVVVIYPDYIRLSINIHYIP